MASEQPKPPITGELLWTPTRRDQIAARLGEEFEANWQSTLPLPKPQQVDSKRVDNYRNRLRAVLQDPAAQYNDENHTSVPPWQQKTVALFEGTGGKDREAVIHAMAGFVDQAARNITDAFETAARIMHFAGGQGIAEIAGNVRILSQTQSGQTNPQLQESACYYKDQLRLTALNTSRGEVIYENL